MVAFAAISEIPFNLVAGSRFFYPLHQNVLWTFSIGIVLMWINENAKGQKFTKRITIAAITVFAGIILGTLTFCDYHYAGIFTILVFYFFRGRSFKNFILQFICLWYINTEIISGFYYEWEIFGTKIEVLRQSFSLLAIIPIWLYKGNHGLYNKGIRALYYWFYPAHLFALWLIKQIIA